MRCAWFLGVLLAILAASAPADAITLDEVIRLKNNGIGDDLIVAMMRSDGSRFDLGPAEIQRLHSAGVSERVIGEMRVVSAPAPVPQAAPPEYDPLDRDSRRGGARPSPAPETRPENPAVPGSRAVVTLHARDERVKAYAWDPGRRELRFYPEARKDAKDFAKGASVPLDVDPGVIALRWDGEYQHYRISLLPGARLDLFVEPTVANGAQAIRVALVYDGRFYAGYNLKVFYGRAVASPGRYCPPCPACPQGAWIPAVEPAPACVIVQPEPVPCPATHIDFSFGAFFGH